ncbi:MAG TPA: hypothetical protein VF137_01370 [Candidatus Dormibacteraeota bacterium]
MFRIPFLTKVLGAGAVGLVLAAGSAAGAGPAINAALASGHSTVTATAKQAASTTARRLGIRARRLVIRSEADVLHLTLRQLRTDVRGGTSVEQLAAKAGMNKSQFTAAVVADLKPRLQKLVQAGKIKQNQADAIIDKVQKGWLPLWTLHPRTAAPGTAAPSASQSPTS